MKYIPINGLKFNISFKLHWFGLNDKSVVEFNFITKDYFEKNHGYLCNYSKDDQFDSLVGYISQYHNAYEIQSVKSMISLLHIVDRMQNTNLRLKKFSKRNRDMASRTIEKIFNISESDYWKNENIYEGYFNNDDKITSTCWNINLGGSPVNRDYFERFSLRYFDDDCIDEYEVQYNPSFICKKLDVNQAMVEKYEDIFELIYSGKETYRKIQAVSYLYFDILNLYRNSNLSVMTMATILETLLLKKNESNQRKKASVRAACIVADNMAVKRKNYVANGVYVFYEYRNGIVHDGKSYMAFTSEYAFDNLMSKIKNLIFCIIRFYIDNKIETIDELKQIVQKNVTKDHLNNAFDYITINESDEPRAISDFLIYYSD